MNRTLAPFLALFGFALLSGCDFTTTTTSICANQPRIEIPTNLKNIALSSDGTDLLSGKATVVRKAPGIYAITFGTSKPQTDTYEFCQIGSRRFAAGIVPKDASPVWLVENLTAQSVKWSTVSATEAELRAAGLQFTKSKSTSDGFDVTTYEVKNPALADSVQLSKIVRKPKESVTLELF